MARTMAMFLAWEVIKDITISRTLNKNLDKSDDKYYLMASLSMTSLLVFFHANKVTTRKQVRTIYSQPYFHMCISVSQPVRNIGIAICVDIEVCSSPTFERH